MKKMMCIVLALALLAGAVPALAAEEEPAGLPEVELRYGAMATEFSRDKLQNWYYRIQEEYGVNIWDFKPANPQLRYYIVCTEDVIDPVTGRVSEGGYNSVLARHFPISTEDLIGTAGNIQVGGLYLTDDPDLANYALILDFDYTDSVSSFHFSNGTTVPQYNPALTATLLDLTDGSRIVSEKLKTYATRVGENVRTSMLDAAKGKQLYGDCPGLWADDFPDYWDFIRQEKGKAIVNALGEEELRGALRLQPEQAIQTGTRGKAATALQRLLTAFGQTVNVDGEIGAQTMRALNAVQETYGLEQTETLDLEGYQQLLELLLIVRDPDAADKLLPRLTGQEQYDALRALVKAAQEA